MQTNFNFKSNKINSSIDDPQDTVEYWRKLAPKIWTTKKSVRKALLRFEQLKKSQNLFSKKSIKAKIMALKELLKTY